MGLRPPGVAPGAGGWTGRSGGRWEGCHVARVGGRELGGASPAWREVLSAVLTSSTPAQCPGTLARLADDVPGGAGGWPGTPRSEVWGAEAAPPCGTSWRGRAAWPSGRGSAVGSLPGLAQQGVALLLASLSSLESGSSGPGPGRGGSSHVTPSVPVHLQLSLHLAPAASASVSFPVQSSAGGATQVRGWCPPSVLPGPHLLILCLLRGPAPCRNPRWRQVAPSTFLGPSHPHSTGLSMTHFALMSTPVGPAHSLPRERGPGFLSS